MKKYKMFSSLIIVLLILQIFNVVVFANSSWVWISETRPYDILPWVAICTLGIETISLVFIAKIKKGFKVFSFVAIANIISFATPYLINFILYSNSMFTYEKYLEHWPSYTVGVLFCGTTVLIELPIVYLSLRKEVAYSKQFLLTIVGSNIVTTLLVAIVERFFCVGNW